MQVVMTDYKYKYLLLS